MIMFGIYDLKGEYFFAPFFERSEETAIRVLSVQFAEDSFLAKYPEDFVLYKLAKFDAQSGAVTECEKIRVCRIDEIYNQVKKRDYYSIPKDKPEGDDKIV